MDESTVVPCAAPFTPGTDQALRLKPLLVSEGVWTKGVQQQATYRDHRKRLRATLVVGEMIFRLHEGKYNIQLTDRTRAPKETEKEEGCVPDLAPGDT